jgi:hypothetical protein
MVNKQLFQCKLQSKQLAILRRLWLKSRSKKKPQIQTERCLFVEEMQLKQFSSQISLQQVFFPVNSSVQQTLCSPRHHENTTFHVTIFNQDLISPDTRCFRTLPEKISQIYFHPCSRRACIEMRTPQLNFAVKWLNAIYTIVIYTYYRPTRFRTWLPHTVGTGKLLRIKSWNFLRSCVILSSIYT